MANEDGATSPSFQIFMAVCIAVVSVTSALIAWRAAVLSQAASNADFAGTVTVIRREEALTNALTGAYARYRAYSDFTANRVIADQLAATADAESDVERLGAENVAQNNRFFLDTSYLAEDGTYDLQADIASDVANANLRTSLDPMTFDQQAGDLRERVRWLRLDFIVLSGALLCFTVAEGLHAARRTLRFSLTTLGVFLWAAAVGVVIYAEVLL
ncbi:MAG: hypothetical protein AAF125_14625 [Chloroflexota bacterium]